MKQQSFLSTTDSLEQKIILHLLSKKETISTAESCTGGAIAAILSSVPGASGAFLGGVVVYSNESKKKLIGISSKSLTQFGAVSEEIVRKLAIGCKKIVGTTYALAIVGFLGPTGGTPKYPLGTVLVALCSDQECIVKKTVVSGSRKVTQKKATHFALSLLAEKLLLR